MCASQRERVCERELVRGFSSDSLFQHLSLSLPYSFVSLTHTLCLSLTVSLVIPLTRWLLLSHSSLPLTDSCSSLQITRCLPQSLSLCDALSLSPSLSLSLSLVVSAPPLAFTPPLLVLSSFARLFSQSLTRCLCLFLILVVSSLTR